MRHGTPRPCWYCRRTRSPGPFGAISTTSRSLRGLICLKWMLKPCANRIVAPLPMPPITSLYRSFCDRSGVRNATSAAPATASTGSRDFQSVLLRLGPAGARPADADHDIEAAVLQIECMSPALAAVAEDGDAGALEGLLVDVLLRVDLHVRSRRDVGEVKSPRCARSQRINGDGQLGALARREGETKNRTGIHHMAAELVKLRYPACSAIPMPPPARTPMTVNEERHGSIPIHLLYEDDLDQWRTAQDEATRNWSAANCFKAERGKQLVVPGAQGRPGCGDRRARAAQPARRVELLGSRGDPRSVAGRRLSPRRGAAEPLGDTVRVRLGLRAVQVRALSACQPATSGASAPARRSRCRRSRATESGDVAGARSDQHAGQRPVAAGVGAGGGRSRAPL